MDALTRERYPHALPEREAYAPPRPLPIRRVLDSPEVQEQRRAELAAMGDKRLRLNELIRRWRG